MQLQKQQCVVLFIGIEGQSLSISITNLTNAYL